MNINFRTLFVTAGNVEARMRKEGGAIIGCVLILKLNCDPNTLRFKLMCVHFIIALYN